MAKSEDQCIMKPSNRRKNRSNKNNSKMELPTTQALVVYVSREDWIKSVLEGKGGRVHSPVHVHKVENVVEEEVEDYTNYKFEDDILYLRSLDPKEWKEQDHYAVLGIKELRHKATEDVIKRAYKHKILKHHPDKRKAQGEEIREDDDYFTCITRAWETLGNPIKRRSYDSVDPKFNDALPEEKAAKDNFYVVMTKAFNDNARFSNKQPVPKLGDPSTPREQVESFYLFWYDFDSWREFSYEDEEDKESGQDRETRKWIEKKNKQVRLKKKKEEGVRIRTLVDMAYNLDPRIRAFQQADKEKKLAIKRAKQEAARARQWEEEREAREAAEKERMEKEKKEAEEKAKAIEAKKERDALKNALRRERKAFRNICKAENYFTQDTEEKIKHMENVEKVCELFKHTHLAEVTKSITEEGKPAFLRVMQEVEEKIEAERRAPFGQSDSKNLLDKQVKAHTAPWSETDLQLLIKAVNLFPAGTNQRWEVVANFINQHSGNAEVRREAKEVLAKAKDLQSTDFSKSSLKEQANKKAFDNFIAEKKHKDVDERMPAVTERMDNPLQNGIENFFIYSFLSQERRNVHDIELSAYILWHMTLSHKTDD
ncbi:hypothetical protein TKK_0000575 [Trichogramma kaykai]